MHGKDQELTTELWSSPVRPEMVRRRRLTVTHLWYTELAGADWRLPCMPGLIEEDKEVTAELWSSSAILRVASIDSDGTWPELGFRFLQENSGKGKN
jgi:hypothetical protein